MRAALRRLIGGQPTTGDGRGPTKPAGGAPAGATSAAGRSSVKPATPKTGAATPGAVKTGAVKTGAARPGASKTGAARPGTRKPGIRKTGAAKPGAAKPGVPKPGPAGRHLAYAPNLDGQADPGEVVWTWVTYEDDPSQGKDRPVLIVGRETGHLLGLMLSSQHDRDGQPNWLALGPGAWDGEQRPSWIRLDRVLTVAEDGIRREGAILEQARFAEVATALRAHYGWH